MLRCAVAKIFLSALFRWNGTVLADQQQTPLQLPLRIKIHIHLALVVLQGYYVAMPVLA